MKLLIADDHNLFRDALVQYIQRADPKADVALAKDFYETLEILTEDDEFDLVVLDLRMPGMNGMAGVRQFREQYEHIPVALMSGVAETEDVKQALDLGIAGYFPKTLSGKALIKAIQSVIDGEVFVPMDSGSRYIRPAYYDDGFFQKRSITNATPQDEQGEVSGDEFNLTPRERDVLSYLVTGAANKEIAAALSLQVVTVKLHVRGICRKLGAKNRTQAALIARENQIILKQPSDAVAVTSQGSA
jgi:two-component system nitrate/nitrite response regulator NarL